MSREKSFEEAMKRLEGYAQRMGESDLPLEEAIACYEKGRKEYEVCRAILDEARQRIITIEED